MESQDGEPGSDVSVVVPVHDERGSLIALHAELSHALRDLDHEIIFVDDGSSDGSGQLLDELAAGDDRVRVLHLTWNYGQTAAMAAGMDHARGRILVPIDADGQNDPADIPMLVATLDEGYDVVSGWRRRRHDAWLDRVLPSQVANALISWVSGVSLHDHGCTLKAYRREFVDGIRLYGEMHRFLLILAAWRGARVTEREIGHRPRTSGRSKYGLGRTWRVLLDLLTIRFLAAFATKPIHGFGGFGLLCGVVAMVALGASALPLATDSAWIGLQTALPLVAAVCGGVGIVAILVGLAAELVIRAPYNAHRLGNYHVSRDSGPPSAWGRGAPRDEAETPPLSRR